MTVMEVWFASSFREEIMPFLAKLVLKSDEEVSIIENEVNMYANKDVAQKGSILFTYVKEERLK